MQRRLTLAKNSFLWEEGDQARNIAIVEKGKLAVKTDDGIVGIVLPKMVVGKLQRYPNGDTGESVNRHCPG